MKWYKYKKTEARVTKKPIIINRTKILIGNSPTDGFSTEDAKLIDAWVNVSDQIYNSFDIPPWNPIMHFHPLSELHFWDYRHVWHFKKIMDNLVFENKKVKIIYVHCAAGAERSPMSVYMWLMSHYGMINAAKIMRPGDRKLVKNTSVFYKTGRKQVHTTSWHLPDEAWSEPLSKYKHTERDGKKKTYHFTKGRNWKYKTPYTGLVNRYIRGIKRGVYCRRLDLFFKIMMYEPGWSLGGHLEYFDSFTDYKYRPRSYQGEYYKAHESQKKDPWITKKIILKDLKKSENFTLKEGKWIWKQTSYMRTWKHVSTKKMTTKRERNEDNIRGLWGVVEYRKDKDNNLSEKSLKEFYVNELIKQKVWNKPEITKINKDKPWTKKNIRMVEIEVLVNELKFKDIKIINKENYTKVRELK